MEQWHFFFLRAALLLYCSDSLFVKCVVNVTKRLKQTKLHPGGTRLHVLLQQGHGPLPPPPAGSMLDVIIKKTFCQAASEGTGSKTSGI